MVSFLPSMFSLNSEPIRGTTGRTNTREGNDSRSLVIYNSMGQTFVTE